MYMYTPYNSHVAGVVGAVGEAVTAIGAVLAEGQNILRHSSTDALVEHVVHPAEHALLWSGDWQCICRW